MFALLFLVFCFMLFSLARRNARRGRPAPQAKQLSLPDRIQDRWTALDDRQLARLLDDSAPC